MVQSGKATPQRPGPGLSSQPHPEIVVVRYQPMAGGRKGHLVLRAFNPTGGTRYLPTMPVNLRVHEAGNAFRLLPATRSVPRLMRTQHFDVTFELESPFVAANPVGRVSSSAPQLAAGIRLEAETFAEGQSSGPRQLVLQWPKSESYTHEPMDVRGVFEQTLDSTRAPERTVEARPSESPEEEHARKMARTAALKPLISVADSTSPPLAATVLRGQFLADAGLGGLDANIAAGPGSVLVTVSRRLMFYDKSGQPLKTKDGSKAIGSVKMTDFFQPLVDDIKANLQLSPTFVNKGLDVCDYYDSRCLYDPYRKRFWIVTLVTNKFTVDDTGNRADQAARRNKIACAVSKTSDPRDGFWMYWWDATPYDGQPNTDWKPGDRGDYPCIGISQKFLMQANHVNILPPGGGEDYARWTMVTLLDADALAAGKPRSGWMFPRLKDTTGKQIDGTWMPAMQYGAFPSGRAYLSGVCGNKLLVYGFDTTFGFPKAPKLASAPLREIAWPPHAAQKSSTDVPYPPEVKIGNVSPVPLRTVARGDRIWTTFHEGVTWSGQSASQVAIRYIRGSLASFANGTIPTTAASGFIERTFGKRNQNDPAGDVFGYGMPAIEVDQNGNALIAYLRSGSTIFQEARFTLHFANESDVRPSVVLRPGEGTYPKNGDKPVAQSDCIGVALDPDGKTIWMAAPYAFRDGSGTKAKPRIAVGKVRF